MFLWLLIPVFEAVQVPCEDWLESHASKSPMVPHIWAQLEPSGKAGSPGAFRVIVRASALPEIGSAQFDLVLAPELERPPVINPGNLLGNALLDSNEIQPGRLRIAFVSSEPLPEQGELLTIECQLKDLAKSSPSLQLENVKAWKVTDSSEVDIRIGQSELNPTAQSTAMTPLVSPGAQLPIAPEHQVTANPFPATLPLAINLPESIQITVSSPLDIRIELPGWFYFFVGASSTLVFGLLALLVCKRS